MDLLDQLNNELEKSMQRLQKIFQASEEIDVKKKTNFVKSDATVVKEEVDDKSEEFEQEDDIVVNEQEFDETPINEKKQLPIETNLDQQKAAISSIKQEQIAPESQQINETQVIGEPESSISDDLREVKISEEAEHTTTIDDTLTIKLEKLKKITRKKERMALIDELGAHIAVDSVKDTFIDILRKDPSAVVRAKCASYLSDIATDSEAREALIMALKDPSPKVRHWAVWGLATVVSKSEVKERLVHHLLYNETSKLVRYWLLKVLSPQIDDEMVEQAFLQLLRSNPEKRMKRMLIDYLSKKIDDIDVVYTLSSMAIKEQNREIKEQLFKILLDTENTDAKYAVERIKREEKDSLKWIVEHNIAKAELPKLE